MNSEANERARRIEELEQQLQVEKERLGELLGKKDDVSTLGLSGLDVSERMTEVDLTAMEMDGPREEPSRKSPTPFTEEEEERLLNQEATL